jgi:transaldolase
MGAASCSRLVAGGSVPGFARNGALPRGENALQCLPGIQPNPPRPDTPERVPQWRRGGARLLRRCLEASLKLFLDTAHIADIETAVGWGILQGITTNPSLAAKEGLEFHDLIKEITDRVGGPVSAEVVADDRDEMVAQGQVLRQIADNVVVKVPMSREGVAAGARLVDLGIPINVTLVFSTAQAILAATIGATFVSPFLGRVDDIGNDGLGLLAEIVETYAMQGYETEVLAASLRHPVHVVQAARIGADAATMPFAVMDKLFDHPLTDIGSERFNKDWEAYQQALAERRAK